MRNKERKSMQKRRLLQSISLLLIINSQTFPQNEDSAGSESIAASLRQKFTSITDNLRERVNRQRPTSEGAISHCVIHNWIFHFHGRFRVFAFK